MTPAELYLPLECSEVDLSNFRKLQTPIFILSSGFEKSDSSEVSYQQFIKDLSTSTIAEQRSEDKIKWFQFMFILLLYRKERFCFVSKALSKVGFRKKQGVRNFFHTNKKVDLFGHDRLASPNVLVVTIMHFSPKPIIFFSSNSLIQAWASNQSRAFQTTEV